MDTMTIIYIVVAFVVGAILTSIFKKGSNSASSDNAKLQELEAENGSLKEKKDLFDARMEQLREFKTILLTI